MDLRERVARAIYEAERIVLGDEQPSERHFKVAIVRYLAAADAAIAEMRRHFAADLARAFNGDQEALARVVFGLGAAGAETTPEAPPTPPGTQPRTPDAPEATEGATGERGAITPAILAMAEGMCHRDDADMGHLGEQSAEVQASYIALAQWAVAGLGAAGFVVVPRDSRAAVAALRSDVIGDGHISAAEAAEMWKSALAAAAEGRR